jgi:minor extracellular serine protease Vpr
MPAHTTKGERLPKRILLLLLGVVALAMLATTGTAGTRSESDGGTSAPTVDQGSALVQLKGAPLATSEKTKPAKGKKIDFSSNAVKSHRAELAKLRNDFKQWLRANAPAANVRGEFDISLNAVAVELNGVSLQTLRSAPMVAAADLQGLYRPRIDDPDLAIIMAEQAWAVAGGPSTAGAGIKVAIIDTGIDVTHPCFADGNPSNDGRFTNDKVVFAGVFHNKAGNQGYTPADQNGHGTHVAGTVACNFRTGPATVNGALIPYNPSGVAPAARLGNFNVFPADVADARSEDIMNALEAALEQGFDVANMSLGGGSNGMNDLLAHAVDNADEANMVVAVAAGNSGPGAFTIESPGKAARALTAGASTVPHFVGAPVTVDGATYGAAAGDFKTVTADLTAPLGVVLSGTSLSLACAALPAGSLTGKIALVSRGTCTFSEKIRNAQDAGAVATLVVNNVAGDPTAMGLGGIANEPTIPAYMVGLQHRAALIADDGKPTTIDSTNAYFLTTNVDIRAGFSSEGPTDVDFRVKPDVMAPGVNVLSSQPASACAAPPCWAFFQGTSMATPHLAGSAAVVRSQHPAWTSAEVRSAIVNTADQGVIKSHVDGTTVVNNVNIVGTGRENLLSSANAKVALDPVSVSFGSVPSGSGQTRTATVVLTNLQGTATGVTVANQTGGGVTYAASLSGKTITVTMTAATGAIAGHNQAVLRVLNGSTEIAHAAVYTLVK